MPAQISYELSKLPGRPPKPLVAYADCFTVRMADIPSRFWLGYVGYTPNHLDSAPDLSGCLADRELPEEYKKAGSHYPTAKEYALVTASEIGYPTDEELAEWLRLHCQERQKLRAALVLLRSTGDPKLKEAALKCAAVPDSWCSLKEEAFRILADMKGDPDAEQLFIDYLIDYLIDLEPLKQYRPAGSEMLTDLANSFWE